MLLDPPAKPRRKPSLTPMIDVVFLLLVFFMLASRFGTEAVLDLPLAGQGGAYTGPPRLIGIGPNNLDINGVPVADSNLAQALAPLMQTPGDMLVLRGRGQAGLQRLTDVAALLRQAGFTNFVLVE
ncbi:biopolymer transporter ExbD (plasmid) [Leisingera aquaemixtae]|uniref:Biopolymer transporter ExbD n=1 Tax=Leisingera aquaemixtae TaxID=1396826 RepID=A0ABY5WPY4_9RHOB|nr:biopolymer transporter ExbD [Leisingera aquaemixtae]UWQ43557.1 biopolymer transporter ExbD [Leisingera aquaemixtae]